MNLAWQWEDVIAVSPLWILLVAALIVLLIESFAEGSKKSCFSVACAAVILAFTAAIFADSSGHALLTPWLSFDAPARFFTLFFLAVGFASTLLASSFFHRFEATQGEYYFLLLASLFGLILIGASADFLTLFLGLETLSISLYILCGYMKKWDMSHEAAIKYFLTGSAAAAFFLYGVALIYGATGTTQLNGLLEHYQSLSTASSNALFLGGVALITVGLAFKAALVPFHFWAPDVYDGSPSPVTAFMAVGTKAGAFAALARLFLVVLPDFRPGWNQLIAWLAIATLIYANIMAIRQVQLRRFFAYSGISHAGFLLIPFAAGTAEALPALCFYLVVYALATLGSFAVLAFLDNDRHGPFLNDLSGLFYRAPFLAGIFALCLLTLAGIPPTAGFFAKFYVLKLAFQSGHHVLVVIGLLTTIFSVFYYLRIVSFLFSEESKEGVVGHRSWPAAAVGVFAFAAIVLLSFYPDPLLTLFSP